MSEKAKKLKLENKMLKLQEDEYQLEMILYDDNSIEFKVTLNSPMADCYYSEKYDLETIVEISLLLQRKFKDMETVYQHYKARILSGREINLELSPDKNIMSLKYQKIVDDEEVPVGCFHPCGFRDGIDIYHRRRLDTVNNISLHDLI